MTANSSLPIPHPNESLERYTIRAHQAAMQAVPDPMERNELIWNTWRSCRGLTDGEKRAEKCFSSDKYAFNPNVCVFDEHQTANTDGTPKKYDVRDLVKIVRDNNERISDREAFSAISNNHTLDDPAANAPEILGFAGPYRLGMIGNDKPTWAIFADEFHDKEKLSVIKNLPRRSVELLTFRHSGKQIFDPIAALGSTAPRLSLPVRYDRTRVAEVERYAIGALVGPAIGAGVGALMSAGGGNTHVKKEINSSDGDGEKPMVGQNELVAACVQAIMATPEMQAVRSHLMGNTAAAGATPHPAAGAAPGAGAPPPAVMHQRNSVAAESEDDISDLLELEQNSAKKGTVSVERFNALEKSHNSLVLQTKSLLEENTRLGRERSDANRRSAIVNLSNRFPGVVNQDEEIATCLYSAGSGMSDAEFDKHVATIERFATRAISSDFVRIPAGEMPDNRNVEVDKKAAALAVEIHTTRVAEGKASDWDSALAEARKQLKS